MATAAGRGSLTVAATSTMVLPARPNRVAFCITNTSALTIYLNLSDAEGAAIGEGVPMFPNERMLDSDSEGYECWKGAITAIEATGAATMATWERVRR